MKKYFIIILIIFIILFILSSACKKLKEPTRPEGSPTSTPNIQAIQIIKSHEQKNK